MKVEAEDDLPTGALKACPEKHTETLSKGWETNSFKAVNKIFVKSLADH